MHQRPSNRLAKPAAGPLFSVPATGCAGITRCPGRASRKAAPTPAFDEPTSETIVPGRKPGAAARAASAKTPTVNELFGGAGYAIEAVVEKTAINVLIPEFRDAGATDIIEVPIAKIVH